MDKKSIAVIDAETDPFEYGQVPAPFAWGFYDGYRYVQTWGENCTQETLKFLEEEKKPLIIYAHNGGRFDFHFLIDHISHPIKIINGRIAECRLGRHTLRDSFSALPLPLAAHDKGTIDYRLFHRDVRELHKADISDYLRRDCVSLFDWISNFRGRFGNKLTIGGASISELRATHLTERTTANHDRFFRRWYQGGRVEYFSQGILKGDWKVYDVNSMYPYVMRNFNHPLGMNYEQFGHNQACKILESDRPFFAIVRADSLGAFGVRGLDGILTFDPTTRCFYVSAHELRAAIATGTIGRFEILRAYAPVQWQNFGDFVDRFHTEKLDAKLSGDKTGEMFAKLILNSAYGKFGQNPAKYREYHIRRCGDSIPDLSKWTLACDWGSRGELWESPASNARFNDVAIAASITGAARSVLLEALANHADRPIYCDTDSIVCENLGDMLGSGLGKWKIEATADTAVIIGKKLYVLLQGTEFVKWASKGVNIHPIKILDMARGIGVNYRRDAPNLKFTGNHRFTERYLKPLEQ